MTTPLAGTGSGESAIATDTSAFGVAPLVESVALLLLVSLSAVDDVTLAVSTSVVNDAGVVILIVMDGALPTISVDRVHVTTWPDSAHVQPMPVALWNATLPSGSRFVTTRLDASLGPRFFGLTAVRGSRARRRRST